MKNPSKPSRRRKVRNPLDVYTAQEEHLKGNFDVVDDLDLNIAVNPEDDEEIDEDVFDSDDDEKWGSLFDAQKSYPDRKRKNLLDSESEDASDLDEDDSDDDLDKDLDNGEGVFVSHLIDAHNAKQANEQSTQLSDFVSTLDTRPRSQVNADAKKRKRLEMTHSAPENIYNLAPSQLSISDMLSTLDGPGFSQIKKKVKAVRTNDAVVPPMVKRMKDKLERSAAREKTVKDVSLYQPFVKKMRESEHLEFAPSNKDSLTPSALSATFSATTELEKDVASILEQTKMTEQHQMQLEEGQETVSVEELKSRRAELSKMRSLMFHHEAKLKRASKIKSKAYRKLKKLEKEKQTAAVMEQMRELDPEAWREEQLKAEAQRAKERATLRHKNTGGWARQMLKLQDKDPSTRKAIMEQLQQHEKLTQRIAGDESSDEFSGSDEDGVREAAVRRLEDLEQQDDAPTGLLAMKFMQKAMSESNNKANLTISRVRRALRDGEDIDDDFEEDEQETQLGRMSFDGDVKKKNVNVPNVLNLANGHAARENTTVLNVNRKSAAEESASQSGESASQSVESESEQSESQSEEEIEVEGDVNPWLQSVDAHQKSLKAHASSSKQDKALTKLEKARKEGKRKDKGRVHEDDNVQLVTAATTAMTRAKSSNLSAKPSSKRATANHDNSSSDDDSQHDEMVHVKDLSKISQKELLELAFADDDVLVKEFELEKQSTIVQDVPKVDDGFLPGWGTWSGAGIKARKEKQRQEAQAALLEQSIVAAANQRQDAKLQHVIINDKKQKKSVKLMSAVVPYPFETREQYEASMKMPIGPEWNTANVFTNRIKARVHTKQGHVIKPMKTVKR